MLTRQRWRDVISHIAGAGFATMIGFSASTLAAPTISIDSPDDGATISSDNTIVSGIASGVGDGQGIDLMLVLDDSSSLDDTDPTKRRFEAVRQLLSSLNSNANIHIGAVFFSDNASVDVKLQKTVDDATSEINKAIDNHQIPGGDTAIGDGILKASEELANNGQPFASRIILVFTDGENNNGPDPVEEAEKARLKGHLVYVIGLFQAGSPTAQAGSDNIARAGGGKLFFSENPSDLPALFRGSEIVEIDNVTVTNTTTGKPSNVQFAICNYNALVDLVQGENVLEVVATDTYGETTTASVTIMVPGNNPGAPLAVDSCMTNPYVSGCPPYHRSVKLRPQVLMAGFDPMLIDIVDDSFKVVAVVREGMSPIQNVTVNENTGSFGMAMTLEGQLSNGDKIYSLTMVVRGVLAGLELSNLFGSGVGEYNITAVDQDGLSHSFPNLEFGNNMDLDIQTPPTQAQPYTTQGIRRLKPQPVFSPPKT